MLLALACSAGLLAACAAARNGVGAGQSEQAPSAEPSAEPTAQTTPGPTPRFMLHLEAEDAQATALEVVQIPTGGLAVGDWDDEASRLTFLLDVPSTGYYELNFRIAGVYGESANTIVVNGRVLRGVLQTAGDQYETDTVLVSLAAGRNTICVERGQGSIRIDSVDVVASDGLNDGLYRVDYALSNPNASEQAKELFRYLQSVYGEATLSGQYASDQGAYSQEVQALYRLTGKYPAILGIDLMDYSPSRVSRGAQTSATDDALEWASRGGILTLLWHWNAPKGLIDSDALPWWDGYKAAATTFDLGAALDGSDPEGYALLLRDIDAIAVQLQRLADAGVPVLWRPLHEASGGWFWWGAYGADNYIKLWRLMYDRLTNVHGLDNLIWVYNGQAGTWYPGDAYVDIIAEDAYVSARDYESLYNLFYRATRYTDAPKMIGLAENGAIPDPALLVRDNARWLFFITWSDLFVVDPQSGEISDQYNELEHFTAVYDSETIITLDELPDWSQTAPPRIG